MSTARGFTTPFDVRLLRRANVDIPNCQNGLVLHVRRKKQRVLAIKCGCSEIRGVCGSGMNAEECKERIFDPNIRPNYRVRAPISPFASRQ